MNTRSVFLRLSLVVTLVLPLRARSGLDGPSEVDSTEAKVEKEIFARYQRHLKNLHDLEKFLTGVEKNQPILNQDLETCTYLTGESLAILIQALLAKPKKYEVGDALRKALESVSCFNTVMQKIDDEPLRNQGLSLVARVFAYLRKGEFHLGNPDLDFVKEYTGVATLLEEAAFKNEAEALRLAKAWSAQKVKNLRGPVVSELEAYMFFVAGSDLVEAFQRAGKSREKADTFSTSPLENRWKEISWSLRENSVTRLGIQKSESLIISLLTGLASKNDDAENFRMEVR
jgi:hypothetical protein